MNVHADFERSGMRVRRTPVQQRGNKRIQLLLDVAGQLIDERGIDELTTTEVAQVSGSSVGVVYRYFPNIQSLLSGLAARNVERFTQRVIDGLEPDARGITGAVERTIDIYVDLARTEPGFRALQFGDVIAKRFVEPESDTNSMIAAGFQDLLVRNYGVEPSDELTFDLEVLVEIAEALLNRAFQHSRSGDPRFIDRLHELAVTSLSRYEPPQEPA